MAGLAHVGVGLALTLAAPEAPVVALVVGAEALDILCLPAMLPKRGRSFVLKTTHSLLASILWSAAAMGIAAAAQADLRTVIVIGIAVFSHWILDFITHPMGAIFGKKPRKPLPPDIPLSFSENSRKVGLGLYNHSMAFSLAFDFGVTILGVALFLLPSFLK